MKKGVWSKKWLALALALILMFVLIAEEIYNQQRFQAELKEAGKIPDTYWDEKYQNIKIKDKYKVVFVATLGGEYSYAQHFKFAAERIGWEVRIYHKQINTFDEEILAFDPDFILYNKSADSYINPELREHRSRKYLINHALLKYLNNYRNIVTNSNVKEGILSFHGVISPAKELGILKNTFISSNKIFNGIAALPSTPGLINQPAEPKNLMWCGMGWDKSRSSVEFKKFTRRLSENIPMKVYGPYDYLNYLAPHVYDGYASGMEQINAIRMNGMYLLTHADAYLEEGMPTSRIFEALAANVVVISDKHPFAIEHFGGNFLYFDQNSDAETMYQQVKDHVDWILANPEKAKEMAAKAHAIFLEKFTLENDLVRIAKMHEYVLLEEREMGLRYPLAY